MSRRIVCLALLLVSTCGVGEADAQIRRRIRELRAVLSAPPADPAADPAAAQSPDANTPPPPEVAPPRRGGFFARRLQMRRDLVAQQAAEAQPTLAPPAPQPSQAQALARQQQGTSQRLPNLTQRQPRQALRQAGATAVPQLRALSQQEVANMDLAALQTALSNTSGLLSNELNRFSSAASWQGFLNLPSGIVEEGTIDLAALQTALERFEKVASDPKFAQIADLASFSQARSLLTELVSRADVPTDAGLQLIDPASGEGPLANPSGDRVESLPAPAPVRRMNEGEHSILVRSKG